MTNQSRKFRMVAAFGVLLCCLVLALVDTVAARRMNFQNGSVVEQPASKVHIVTIVARHKDGKEFYRYSSHNLRTNAGIDWQYNQMAGTTDAVCTYIALSNDSGAPSATDTTVASEIVANGLSRAVGAPAHTTGVASYTVAKTFTCATAPQAAQKVGLLNAGSSGTLCFENTFTPVSLQIGDTLQVQWTVNF